RRAARGRWFRTRRNPDFVVLDQVPTVLCRQGRPGQVLQGTVRQDAEAAFALHLRKIGQQLAVELRTRFAGSVLRLKRFLELLTESFKRCNRQVAVITGSTAML